MAESKVCRYFKYGHCRYQERCRYRHVNELCNDTDCVLNSCQKRHPRICIFFKEYKQCKFGAFCNYKHETEVEELGRERNFQFEGEITRLSSRIKKLEEDITALVEENVALQLKLDALELNVCTPIEKEIAKSKENSPTQCQLSSSGGGTAEAVCAEDNFMAKELDDMKLLDARRAVLGPGFEGYPSWGFKTP